MRARHGKKLVMCVMGTVLSCMFSSGAYAQAGVSSDVPPLTAQNSRAVAEEMEPALQRFVDQQKRWPTQAKQVLVKIIPDPVTGVVWIDLDSGYLPKDAPDFSEDFGAMLRDIENEGYELIAGVVRFRHITVRIGGKEINEIYPPEHLKNKRAGASTSAAAAPVGG